MPEDLRLVARTAHEPSPTMRDLLAVVFRQRRLAAMAFVVIFLAVLIYGLVVPSYQSEMRVLLRYGRDDPVVAPTPSQAEFARKTITEEELNSEAELLHDHEILRVVVQNAGLASEGWSWFQSPAGDPDREVARAVRRVDKRLTVEPVRKTSLIAVTYQSRNPEQAAKVLRELAKAYLERHHQLHRPSGGYSFFDQQVAQSRRSLEAAELQLMEFTRDQGVISAAQERDMALQRLSAADADDRQTQVAMAENSERVGALQAKLKVLPERTMTQVRNWDNPQLLEKVKARLLELELKRTELLTKYEPSYRSVQEIGAEIEQTKAALTAESQAPLRDQTSDLEASHAWAKSELIKAQVESRTLAAHATAERALLVHYRDVAHELGDHAIKQEQLLHDLKAAEDKYLLYVNKREEARIGDALDQGGILNVAIAEQPTVPELPKLSALSFAMIGLALAGTLSVSLAFVSDYLNPYFRTPDEVVAYLRAPVLASLPCKAERDAEVWPRGQQ
ncbi:MAG: hypothetical protein LAO09_02430 [Acidobacteriia bacterium]|nr:hypothetical protein [Terriglobia bacterium]